MRKKNLSMLFLSACLKAGSSKKAKAALQLSVTDKITSGYAIVVITKATASNASDNENFNNNWLKLVKGSVQVNAEPTMQAPVNENGWNVISGSADYTDGANKGAATLLTATGGGQTVSVVLMTNTKQYQNELLAFINSLQLSKASPAATNEAGKASVVGLWCDNILETTGTYVNGYPQYTAGYMRKEYAFYPDGTYLFRSKNWQTTMKEILFIYETGTYSVNGNQLIISPKQGKGGWWSKAASGRTTEWGKFVKDSEYKSEKATYSFEIKYYSGTNSYSLILKPGSAIQRDGGNEISYRSYEDRKSIIDNPPAVTTGFENKSFTSSSSSQANNTTIANTVTSPLVGKIWEATSSEKFPGAGAMPGHYTGGFSSSQYQFNADGTYKFIDVLASFYTDTKTYKYETGNYSVSGNQLTINPTKGQNEEWNKVGKTSNGNSDVTNRAINETWGKKIKTNTRKLEQYTYTFSIGKNGDKNALILQRNGHTEREGEGNISYYNETAADRSAKLPNGIN